MDKRKIARRVTAASLKVWLSGISNRVVRLAMEFPTQDALDKYLKEHPKADKRKHRVVETKPSKQEAPDKKDTQTAPGAKFVVPKHRKIDVKVEGDLGNVDKWKAKIVLGNSMSKGKNKGDYDEVGYVAINTKADDIIPIARGDEHQAGYEYLYHLENTGAIKGKVEDYITLFPGNNYPGYSVGPDRMDTYVAGVKKWLAYGGKSTPMVNVQGNYVTDMEEFVSLDGKMPKKADKPTKPAREILDKMEAVSDGIAKKDKGIASSVKALAGQCREYSYHLGSVKDDEVDKMEESAQKGDWDATEKSFKEIASKVQATLSEEKDGYSGEKAKSLFGFDGSAVDRLKKMTGEKKPEVSESEIKSKELKPHAKETVDKLEATAKAGRDSLTNPMAEKRFVNSAKDLLSHLSKSDMADKLKELLEQAEKDIDDEDIDGLRQRLFAWNGIKNALHQHLRDKKDKESDDYFGNVQTALSEFDRLGQI